MICAIPFIRNRVFEHVHIDLDYTDLAVETTEKGRVYITPSGKSLPSITTVLGIRKRHIIQEWRARVGAEEANRITRAACSRGTSLHLLAEKYIKNEEEIFSGKEMPLSIQMFKAIQPVIDKNIGKIYGQELPLYSDHLGVAGRCDLIAEFDGRISIIDFKSSSRVKDRDDITEYFMQESGYAVMFEERTGIPVSRLVTIMAVEGMSTPLIFMEKRDSWVGELQKTIVDYNRLKLFGNNV